MATSTRLPEQATLGLLEYLTAHALDEDYAFVSARRAATAPSRDSRRIGVTGAAMMAVFAILVVVAAVQTARNASSDAGERDALLHQVRETSAQAATDRATVLSLRRETARLQTQGLARDRSATQLLATIQRLGVLSGTLAVRGPGVRVVADDAPHATTARQMVLDSDLQRLVNGFWEAGAEAIALNGQRLTNLSTIRLAGGAITVNARSLSRPYVVTVIGDENTLPARFAETSSGQAWLDLERQVGLRLTITPVGTLRLPATEVTLHYATSSTPGGAS